MNSAAMDVVLTLDISSSGVRSRLHNREMVTVAESAVDLLTLTDSSGMSAHTFLAIRDAVVAVVREVSKTAGVHVCAVCPSGTASSFAWARLDPSQHSDSVSDVLLWSDARANAAWERMGSLAADAFDRTLCPPDPSYWPAKIAWAIHHVELDMQTRFGGGKDFVFHWLTGRFWTDPMSGASTGVFDTSAWRWDLALLGSLGISEAQLPELRAATETAPLRAEVAELLGLEPGLPVVNGGMDGPLTQIGACGFDLGVASCTVGTSIAFRANSGLRVSDPQRRVWCYPIDGDHWVVGGAGNNGGNVLTWMTDRFSGHSVGDLVASAFAVEPDPALLFLPYLTGERAPLWQPDLRAAIIGMSSHHVLGDLVRAAIDGIAAALIELSVAVQSVSGVQSSVRFTGGFIREPRWVQTMTDALGVTTGVPSPDSATATGAAIIGWAAVDGAPITDVFSPARHDLREPDGASSDRLAVVATRLRIMRDLLSTGSRTSMPRA